MIWHLIVCAVIGFIAGRLTGNKTGIIRNVVVGILGGYVGDFIFDALGLVQNGAKGNFVAALIGAVVFLMITNAIFKRK